MKYQTPKGTRDFLPEEMRLRRGVINTLVPIIFFGLYKLSYAQRVLLAISVLLYDLIGLIYL